jgi:hypothetical protein
MSAQLDTSLVSFAGSVFDGRYLYLVPSNATSAVRFDTVQGSFTVGPWWTVVKTGGTAGVWYGGIWDGRFVYFLPHGASPANNLAAFEPSAFTNPGAWRYNGIGPGSYGPAGGAFDGRFGYMVPFTTTAITRFDTDGGLSAATPSIAGSSETAVRFDTTAPKLDTSALEAFDLFELGITPTEYYAGAIFDGRYVYLVPSQTVGVAAASVVTRFDTTVPFTQKGAWSTHNIAPAGGFGGGTFDGRYVYFVPSGFVTPGNAVVARFDTQNGKLDDKGAWSFFDLTKLLADGGANTAYLGASFDGRYVYLIPNRGGIITRFDARSPRALPSFDGGGAASFL